MTASVLLSKLSPPAADSQQVPREHITELLTDLGVTKLVLIHAPAGYGKTTVMGQAWQRLQHEGIATAWMTLDAGDNDARRFLACLQATVSEMISDDAYQQRSALLRAPVLGDAAVELFERLAAIDFPFVLFFDEFEAIHSAGVLAMMGQLIERLPPGGRIVIGTRGQPALRLARLRANGQLLDLDVRDLKFSFDETQAFMQLRLAHALNKRDISLLHVRTEGWPAALWLASLALARNERPGELIKSFSGTESALAHYLAEEVLSNQRESVRLFLLRTSILREVSAPLCQALIPELNSPGILRELAAASVFLIPIEGQEGSWRYHSLFVSFLRAQLRATLAPELPRLHKAAAGAYLQQGRPVPAVEHLIAGGDIASAVALLREEANSLLTQGRLRLLMRWFAALPPGSLDGEPLLQVIHAWVVGYTRGPREAIALIESYRLDSSQDHEVRAHVGGLHASLLIVMDRWEEGNEAGLRSLELLPSPSAYADAALVNVLAAASAVLGRFDMARSMVDQARKSQGQSLSHFHLMYSEAVLGVVDLLDGRLRQGQARFRLALHTSQAVHHKGGLGNAWAGLLYATSVYESDELLQAQHLLQVYLPLAREAWLPDHTILGYLLLSRIAFFNGDIDEAFDRISELEYLGHERLLPRFVATARLERAWLLLRQGHGEAAATELSLAADSELWRSVGQRRHLTHDWDDLEIGRARWELIAGDAEKAQALLSQLLATAQSLGYARRALKVTLLHAMAQARCGRNSAALASLMPLLKETANEGAIRLFVDEGPMAAALILQAQDVAGDAEPLFADYLQRLVAAFGSFTVKVDARALTAGEPLSIVEPMTVKEIRLLQLVAEGYSNKALSDKLCVSESTVRTHLRNINVKLGADNRTHAVSLARRHGLIR